ncbi:ABC transporter permease [Kitasatospora kifunensis]|uniref:NitT/TauT family transport system permease protein n=1 Tax=Kitasatospora kifunensis TaxID=58351 RepID=A0A7W7VX12_KITKI|nr:ABC transporter permease subunit [Kitasatospora kifunensis]MBB4925140.1 NitT/TauT family transport system permease protein [Kitasatospora kifunensis]
MAGNGGFPSRGVWRRPALRWVDVLVAAALVALLYGLLELAPGLNAPFLPNQAPETVSTDPANLPYYAVRSLLRMFVALIASVLFTFVYAIAAARMRRTEKVLLPVLDILQSVPVLGFLSVTVTAFIALFPGSALGLECASIFAIFTAMAWNMTFAFYYSLTSQPRELDEAARVMRLTKWQRFWRLDVPSGMIPLVWNGMMSFGGAWFFLAASESISVLNHHYALPGMGSYAAAAIAHGNLRQVVIAIVVMVIMVIGINVLFWRPMTAWSERFRVEESEAAERPRSVVLDLLRRSSVPARLGRPLRPVGVALDHGTRLFGLAERPLARPVTRERTGDVFFAGAVAAVVVYGAWRAFDYVHTTVGLGEFGHALALGAATFARVVVLLIVATAVWVPIGVWIGMNPKVTRLAQPIVQVLASFPANFLFPFATVVFLAIGISLNLGSVLLMALGAQWYILFNVIAGASAIPSDLREAMTGFHVGGWLRWRSFILPAVFPYYVTGGITAAGGAWNASIVAEVVDYGSHHLKATGLGAYIADATGTGDFPKILVGVTVMSVYVVALNRVLWRRLYRLAETRYAL